MLGGAGGRNKSIIDLLANSDALKASIDAHSKATEARIKSAEDHRKAKEDAVATLNKLKQKQAEHDERERQLDVRHKALNDLSGQLNSQIADYNFKHRDLEDAKVVLENKRMDQQRILKQMTDDVLAKDQAANQKLHDLEQKLLEAAKQRKDIQDREALVIQRETMIAEFADQLRGK